MAFTFGNASSAQPAFGSTPAKAAAFGTAFGATPTSSTANFGFGSSFSSAAAQQPFGSAFPSAPNAFAAQPQTGGLFGTAPASKPAFGQPTTAAPGLFSTATANAGGLFAAANPAPSGLFGSAPAAGPFGQVQTAAAAPGLFGNAGAGLFGTAAAGNASPFGGGFGTGAAAAPAAAGFGGFGGFGAKQAANQPAGLFGSGSGSVFGVKSESNVPVSQPNQNPNSNAQQVLASIYAINVFGDERDDVLKKWNMLQACWGCGKGYYSATQPPVEYDTKNPFYQFKAMGYNTIPEHDNSEGIVKLVFGRKLAELREQQEVLKNGIAGVLGHKPNLCVEIVQIRALLENQTELKITVSEKGVTGSLRKIPASDLSAFLNQPTQKQQLASVGVTSVTPFVTPSKAELEEYLKQPPPGIDKQMWRAAVQDNPDPKRYVPVAINGAGDLRLRMQHQEYQTGVHQAYLEKADKEAELLRAKHATSLAQIAQLQQKLKELQHRILRVLVKQETTRKIGIAIQPDEEVLGARLEMMHTQLNIPKQFKGQINELLSSVKILEGAPKQSVASYRVDSETQEDIRQFLKMQQSGIAQLVKIINGDLQAVKIISDGMKEFVGPQFASNFLTDQN